MSKKFFLEELLDELRSLGEQYEMDDTEVDVFLLKPNELNVFAEDIQKIIKDFIDKELILEEVEDEDLDNEEFDDIFWLDDDDELE